MLTPVDIQQKKFHMGIGYDKKDVNEFFKEVVESYEQLYRSNAELKESVNTLTDGLQNYKSKEAALEKSLMLAEKDSEDTKSRATKEAKNIELDAKNKAKNIVSDAEKRLAKITEEIKVLETQYAAYKSNLCSLMKMQFEFLQENDFDVDAYIDEKALSLLPGGGGASHSRNDGGSFGSFTGDPQMRDESTLGGAGGGGGFGDGGYGDDSKTSTSAVYTAGLGANENFVDPFNPDKSSSEGRYNPYDGRTVTEKNKSGTTFRVNTGKSSSRKPSSSQAAKKTTSSSSQSVKKEASATKDSKPGPEAKRPTESERVKPAPQEEKKVEAAPKKEEPVKESAPKQPEPEIPTIETIIDDVEVDINETALIGDGTEPNENEDEDGFEFV